MLRSERALQAKVLAWLRALPDSLWENRAPGPFSATGVADITGCYRGRFVAIELKHPRTGKPEDVTPEQVRYLKCAYLAGGYALATNYFERVQALIAQIDYEHRVHVRCGYLNLTEAFT